MPRKAAFSTTSLYVHFQPTMMRTFPVQDGVPSAMQACLEQLAAPSRSVADRLMGLKRLIDDEARRADRTV